MPIHKKRNGLYFPPDEIDKNAKLNSFVNFINLIDIKLLISSELHDWQSNKVSTGLLNYITKQGKWSATKRWFAHMIIFQHQSDH